jgi:hypothetical protein
MIKNIKNLIFFIVVFFIKVSFAQTDINNLTSVSINDTSFIKSGLDSLSTLSAEDSLYLQYVQKENVFLSSLDSVFAFYELQNFITDVTKVSTEFSNEAKKYGFKGVKGGRVVWNKSLFSDKLSLDIERQISVTKNNYIFTFEYKIKPEIHLRGELIRDNNRDQSNINLIYQKEY